MTFFSRWVLPLTILVGIVGGVTFLSHYRPAPPRRPALPVIAAAPVVLTSDDPSVAGTEDGQPKVFATEVLGTDHQDFRYSNQSTQPAVLSLKAQSCGCFDVQVAFLSAEEAARPATSPLDLPAGRWQTLQVKGKDSIDVPPQSRLLLRMNWTARSAATMLLRTNLTAQRGTVNHDITLESRVDFVVPVLVWPEDGVRFNDLVRPGQQETSEFICWSATREHFGLTAEKVSDSRITVECQPLDKAALEESQKKMGKPNVKSGYRVRVTVAERQGESEPLDLGPLQRSITLLPEGMDPLTVPLTGMVRGEVRLLNSKDGDVVNLGVFPRDHGKEARALLTVDRPGLKLKLVSWKPDNLKVRLDALAGDDTQPRWELKIDVPRDSVEGRLPADSSVILETQGEINRRMRIPLVGQATR
jgi:hypothetical protein